MLLKHLVEYDNLEQEKQNIIAKISGLSAENEQDAALLDRIYKVLNTGTIGTNIETALKPPSADENMSDAELQKHRQEVTKIISGLDSDYKSLNTFLKKLESGGVVNIDALNKPLNSLSAVFDNDPIAVKAFTALARYGVGVKQKGPGEFALAMLSDKVRLASGEGDLEIDGIGKVELKAALGSAGGRIGYGGGSQKAKRAVIDKYAERIPTVVANINANPGGSLGFSPFVNGLNADLPLSGPNAAENKQLRKQIATELFTMDIEGFTGPVADAIAKSDKPEVIEKAYLEQNFAWYKDRDNFDALLLISFSNLKSGMIKNAADLTAFRNSGHAYGTRISIIPTQAGAGREQWAQLTLNKAKV